MQNESFIKFKNKKFPIPAYLKSEKSQKYFGAILTLCAISFFGIFAIKPTISTILQLRKEITDSEYVLEQAENKIKNLSILRKQYSNLKNDLEAINNAITIKPEAHLFLGQLQAVANSRGLVMKTLKNSEVGIVTNNQKANNGTPSFNFSFTGTGARESLYGFIEDIANMQRLININLFTINSTDDNQSSLSIEGVAFFKNNL